MTPTISSQGYHFSVLVGKNRKLRGFICPIHHTKTKSCRTAMSNRWGLRVGTPNCPQASSLNTESCYRCRHPLLLSASILSGFVKKKARKKERKQKKKNTMRVGWLQGLLDASVLLLVWRISALSVDAIRNQQWQWQDMPAFAPRLVVETALQSSPLFLGAIWPEAMANGLLTSHQALRRQVVSHCQAALIRSYNSCRDSHILEGLASGSTADWQTC